MKKNEVNNCCTLCSECLLLLLQSAAVETTQADTFCSLSTQPLKRKKEQKNVYFAWFKKKKKDLSPRPCRPNIKPPGFRALYINMTSTTSRSCSKLCISIEALFRSKDSNLTLFLWCLGSAMEARSHCAGTTLCLACPVAAPCIMYAFLCGQCAQKCPLPALVIGNPLTMNNDRHQGAKCPVQDTVGISRLTGGKQHLFGCWMQRWFISLANTPCLKVAVSCFRNALGSEFKTMSIIRQKHSH